MRISGGKYRGKTLFSPKSEAVRPTSDRMREAIFNILRSKFGGDFSNLTFFDVFAGSGAMGFEAISQGFGEVYFFDIDTAAILKNSQLFPNEKPKVIKGDILKATPTQAFANVLFMDAPYNKGLTEKALIHLSQNDFLQDDALCLIEVEKNEELVLPKGFELIDERKYGLAKLVKTQYLSI